MQKVKKKNEGLIKQLMDCVTDRQVDRQTAELNGSVSERGGEGVAEFWLLLQFFCNSGAYSPWSADNPRLFSQLHQVSVCLYQPGIRAAPSLCVCECECERVCVCPRCLLLQ